ncbi:MAG TPA: sulfotransferase family 2 domain-containing protein [Xanthomonadaceae bacterium]|nr:sulfotransferase family 2 domain-containing protein [Xanthomonadaceae bacterium]
MISHHDRCVFVHIPKCAGQSVEMFFLNRAGLDWERRAPLLLRANDVSSLGPPRLAHLKARQYVDNKWMTQTQFDEYFKFAFVRNPWDRTASFYRYLQYDRRCSFSRFVLKHLPEQIEKKNWFLCPQAEYIYDSNGNSLVDFVGRFETLAKDFTMACERIGVPNARLPHVNDSRRSKPGPMRWLRRRALPYRDMYDSHSMKLVEDLYKADIEAFDYRF